MKITIPGAAGGEGTGSAYYVQTRRAGVLVDRGLFQGGQRSEALNRPPTGPKQKLDVVLTPGEDEPRAALPKKIQSASGCPPNCLARGM